MQEIRLRRPCSSVLNSGTTSSGNGERSLRHPILRWLVSDGLNQCDRIQYMNIRGCGHHDSGFLVQICYIYTSPVSGQILSTCIQLVVVKFFEGNTLVNIYHIGRYSLDNRGFSCAVVDVAGSP